MELEVKDTIMPSQIVEIWQRVVDSAAILLSVPSVMINRLEPPELEVFRSNISPDNPFPAGTRTQMAGIYCEAAAKKRQSPGAGCQERPSMGQLTLSESRRLCLPRLSHFLA